MKLILLSLFAFSLATGQDRVHRPGGNSIQDPCVTRNDECVVAKHYVVDVSFPYAHRVLESEKVIVARALVSLWDEYERECYADSFQVYELQDNDPNVVHRDTVWTEGGFYISYGVSTLIAWRPFYKLVWRKRDSGDFKDFMDWLKRRKAK